MIDQIAGTRYTVMGLGVLGGGVGVAQYLARHGGIVTVTDAQEASRLQSSIDLLAGLPISFHLGGHRDADFTRENADVVVRNPGVRRTNPYLMRARESGVAIEMEMSLFFRGCRAPILGVTGTKGKTSVSTLCSNILRAWKPETILAGNMGISALNLVDDIQPGQPVVIELSSWQLEALDEHDLGPRVAVVTNITPDHLDSYDCFDHYADTKRTIGRHAGTGSVVVLNHDDPECMKMLGSTDSRVLGFGLTDPGSDGAWLVGDSLLLRIGDREERLPRPTQLQLSGDHGTRNALAAVAATAAYGAPIEAIRAGLDSFAGVRDRMEEVATIDGVLYINDTSASAPAAAVAGLRVLGNRASHLHVIAGGADKQTDLTPFADEIAARNARVILLDGTGTPELIRLLEQRHVGYEGPFQSMAAAFAAVVTGVSNGDVVTLTPGCASFGIFRNEFDRGDQFRAAVHALQVSAEHEIKEHAQTEHVNGATTLPPPPATFHFVGIGGIGMSGLARILTMWGYKVTGSDAANSAQVVSLRALGIPVVIGHGDPTFASLADIVVTNKRAAANAKTELDAAEASGARIIKRGDLLGMVANARQSVCVAGSHGKSTTSGMLAVALRSLSADPTFAVGAIVAATGTNAEPGDGPHMVVEADEFDRSFHGLFPNVAIITSVSFDHPDIYGGQDDYDEAFVQFVRNIKPGGTLIIAADDAGAQRVLASVRGLDPDDLTVQTFGEKEGVDWRLEQSDSGWMVTDPTGVSHGMTLGVPGRHNARNALAALAALHAFGFDIDEASAALGTFTGIGRRFEHKGVVRGADVIDDYAHHPDEINAVLSAARDTFPGQRIVAVHQPHTYSRTHALMKEFAGSLEHADIVVLLEIYGVGEENPHHISSAHLGSLVRKPVHLVDGPEEAARKTLELLQPGDVVMTIGAGTITRVGPLMIEADEQAHDISTPASPERSRPLQRGASGMAAPIVRIPQAPHLQFLVDADMSLYTTMRIGGEADFLVRAQTADDIAAAVSWANEEALPVTVIGGGSNLLVGDGGVRGLVIVCRTPGQRAESLLEAEDQGDDVLVTIGAQAPLSWVGRYCAEHGWSGMDWGVGLPGQIGGATVNNAGAHGTELTDHLVAIDLLQDDGKIVREDAVWLEPSYRMSKIKGSSRPRPWTVLQSVFRLPKADPAELVRLADEHADFRERTQPTGACSGSLFANPPGDFAGRLIEEAGLAGYRQGAMQLSSKHANWMINTGGGTAVEAWELVEHVRERVLDRFRIELRPEIERVGEHRG